MAKNSPETESSIIYFRQIGRLHAETVDMMRISIKDLDGTHDGAIYNQLMKYFLHNNATKALAFLREKVSVDGFPPEHPFTLASGMIQNYLGALPLSQDQIISVAYSVCGLNEINALLNDVVPEVCISNLKILNHGRLQIERLEMLLVIIAKSMA